MSCFFDHRYHRLRGLRRFFHRQSLPIPPRRPLPLHAPVTPAFSRNTRRSFSKVSGRRLRLLSTVCAPGHGGIESLSVWKLLSHCRQERPHLKHGASTFIPIPSERHPPVALLPSKVSPAGFGELPPGRFDGLFSDFDWLTAIVGKTFRRLANRRAFWAIVRSIPDFFRFVMIKSPFSKNSWHADLCRTGRFSLARCRILRLHCSNLPKPKRGYYAVRRTTGAFVALESYIPNGKVSGILPDPFVGPAKGVTGEV